MRMPPGPKYTRDSNENRQYRGSGKMPCLGISAIKCPTVMSLLNDYSRIYPHADRREVAVDSAHRLVDSLDRGAQANAENIRPLESLVRQTQM